MDSSRMSNLGMRPEKRPRKKYQRLGLIACANPRCRGLLLEEVAEPSARVVWMHGPARRVALDGHHDREERTLIASALVVDALGDLLGAREATGRVEVRALPAGVELGLALRTASERVGRDPERGPA